MELSTEMMAEDFFDGWMAVPAMEPFMNFDRVLSPEQVSPLPTTAWPGRKTPNLQAGLLVPDMISEYEICECSPITHRRMLTTPQDHLHPMKRLPQASLLHARDAYMPNLGLAASTARREKSR